MSDVFAALVGQDATVALLRAAAAAAAAAPGERGAGGMTHAWLFTGPPGSGRSTAARAFAASLQCTTTPGRPGCGECRGCRTALAGTSADVEVVRPSGLSYGVADTRDLVRRSALAPVGGRWQVVVVEDADRLTEQAANALLKAIEEPPPRTVWLLCAPSAEDLVPTIRSRCRVLVLRTPPAEAVAGVLVAEGVAPALAAFAARAAQGHIGRARRLATDESARLRRADVLALGAAVGPGAGVTTCLEAAGVLVAAAEQEAARATAETDAAEADDLRRALGVGATGRGLPRIGEAAVKDLERQQKVRAKRLQRDALDGALVDLAAFYRDVLAVQLGARADLVHSDQRAAVTGIAARSTPAQTLRRVDAVLACREAVDANVAPLLAAEAMALALRAG